jgi:hypothetical protein
MTLAANLSTYAMSLFSPITFGPFPVALVLADMGMRLSAQLRNEELSISSEEEMQKFGDDKSAEGGLVVYRKLPETISEGVTVRERSGF